MRLSRNRNWGHPELIALVEKLAVDAQEHDGWPGLLVGDISQPRGGPMLTGHASHQVGLDADIWLTPMPDRAADRAGARGPVGHLDAGGGRGVGRSEGVDRGARPAASSAPPPIRRSSASSCIPPSRRRCARRRAKETDRAWLHKVRPYLGPLLSFPYAHRLPARAARNCEAQPALPSDDGCGKEVDRLARI